MKPTRKVVQILKYPNRKLYLPGEGYIDNATVAAIIRNGQSVVVTNTETNEDETLFVLTSLIHIEASRKSKKPSKDFRYDPSDLENLIRRADA